jgi:hypothetical protein
LPGSTFTLSKALTPYDSIIGVVSYRFILIPDRNLYDITHDGELPGILSQVEVFLGIVSACFPFLSPVASKIKSSVVESKVFSYLSSQTGISTTNSRSYTYGTKLSDVSIGKQTSSSTERCTNECLRQEQSDEESIVGFAMRTVNSRKLHPIRREHCA